jgi:hypothetical protein
VISAPTGRPIPPSEVLADCADLVSEAPTGSVERTVLHASYRVALVFSDAGQRLLAVAELAERATGRGLPAERFNATAASGLEIAGRRRGMSAAGLRFAALHLERLVAR